jgi:hypothetical protein
MGFLKFAAFNSQMSKMHAEMGSSSFGKAVAGAVSNTMKTRIGLYLLVLAGLACVASVYLLDKNRDGAGTTTD